jgi:tRNA-2-methylthio-N6-dimethylallyladenosine synthase
LTDKQPLVDILVGPDGYRQLPGLLTKALNAEEQGLSRRGLAVDLSEYETYDDVLPERDGGINAWIAIMRGCDNFCSFCVVPYTRGRERSRDPEGVLREVEASVESGHSQITLLGQNVNSYRHGDWDFARLILAVAEVPGVRRVRFTSPHPKDFPGALLDAVAGHPNICKHIHLPLQSGNDRILELMNRTYSRKEYLDLAAEIRRRHPAIALTTDIICGFCSETEEEFLDTYRVVQEVNYHAAYIFKYSERKNTIAARKFPDDIPEEVKGERVSRLVDLQRPITARINRELIGHTLPVMVENNSKRSPDQWMGRTDTNITVIWSKSDIPATVGDIHPITVLDATAAVLMGRRDAPSVNA